MARSYSIIRSKVGTRRVLKEDWPSMVIQIEHLTNELKLALGIQENLPTLLESNEIPRAPHADMMLYSEVMSEKNTQRPVHSGQVVVISYDLKSDWWKNITVWAWNRPPYGRCLDEVFIVITPFHIIFARVPRDTNDAWLAYDYRAIMGVIDKTLQSNVSPVGGKHWSYMYRLIPAFTLNPNDAKKPRPAGPQRRLNSLRELRLNTVYESRFNSYLYYVPPAEWPDRNPNFTIRVGNYGRPGDEDRPHVQVNDMSGEYIITGKNEEGPDVTVNDNGNATENPVVAENPGQNGRENPVGDGVESTPGTPGTTDTAHNGA
ncbi:hypothetical protein TSTA_013560 [Talaromyces stipitatus ATCC 10500]|uniref:Uncharacterized protein n=1 Tax=Talaromyces stipitatus (strain ATCC 10500 / CBS 375.48 / QM 6759 / NRRL 1006) TaxID=441959 RepID=B8MGD6_TALSN|nr:uncharacterized protein TSTA_013560 [Talaromyces stipitatus ATCC 10500]EED16256.1 hypothetical protein TSTA_013560 [Talaromyces stipitatus ATCC 10500]